MSRPARFVAALSVLWICGLSACAQTSAGGTTIDTSPASPRVATLPLHEGTFVTEDSSCGDPPLAALLVYNGQGFDGAHSHACRAHVVKRRGNRVTLANRCIDAGVGDAPRTTMPLTIKLIDADHFAVDSKAGDVTYRRCPADQLPPSLRQRASAEN
ncbi:hypothetical protein [Salinisphaera hydrothermalis]|uniref:hypothetical protein n=1 Tax=Salinisphaera hydrothermalis TaxID=563188 RepID=UPI0033411FE1